MKWFQSVASSHPSRMAFLIYLLVAATYAVFTDGVIRDDAYIFFTYARNLAQSGVLAFNPGELTFGTTSIAWTGLLTGGVLLHLDVIGVAKVLGALLGAGGAVLFVSWLGQRLDRPLSVGAVAFAALLPNIGADRMVEGMETGLICFLGGLFLFLTRASSSYHYWLQGVILGLLALTRPELSLLIIVAGVVICRTDGIAAATKLGMATVIVAAWWPIWLYQQTGEFLPPTRIGKLSVFLPQNLGVTYGEYANYGLLDRFALGARAFVDFAVSGISELSLIALLITASAFGVWMIIREGLSRSWPVVLAPVVLWVIILLYTMTFPLFQLRYFLWCVPLLAISFWVAIPVLFRHRLVRYIPYALIAVCLLAQIKALPHRIHSTSIQQLRREVGNQLKAHTQAGARVAMEPIGEIGYYANRYIIDMGGITDLRIQPYLTNGLSDSTKMWQCLTDYRADYVVTYDGEEALGCLPRAFPERFELVSYVPPQRIGGVRYRLLKILPSL